MFFSPIILAVALTHTLLRKMVWIIQSYGSEKINFSYKSRQRWVLWVQRITKDQACTPLKSQTTCNTALHVKQVDWLF